MRQIAAQQIARPEGQDVPDLDLYDERYSWNLCSESRYNLGFLLPISRIRESPHLQVSVFNSGNLEPHGIRKYL